MEKERVKICVNNVGSPFFYNGYVIEEKDGFIVFKDDKLGEIRLNKDLVISIVPFKGDSQ